MANADRFQRLEEMPLDELVKKAVDHVCKLASGEQQFRMCVPPQWDDSDMLLIDTIERLYDRVKELEQHGKS